MSDVGQNENLRPIDFRALDRMLDRRAPWVTLPLPPAKDDRETLAPSRLTSREAYEEAKRQKVKAVENELKENGARLSKIAVGDLEAQKALLSADHELYQVMKRVSVRIAKAEARLRARQLLSRDETAEQYQVHITLRDVTNAWTFEHGKAVFFEAGLITLLDKYLKEVKHQPGISEDHIAGLWAHELSHTDEEARSDYLNEEYCDVQGVILAAEAGYNPRAMIDLEDFFVYLEKGVNFYQEADASAAQDKNKKHSILPTHPPSENRRLVIVNLLNNTEGVIPNQTHDYVVIKSKAVEDLRSQMGAWVKERQSRALPLSREAIIEAIDKATNETELAEAMMGYGLLRKAELARIIAENPDYQQLSVLIEAVSTELRSQMGKKEGQVTIGYEKNDVGLWVGDEMPCDCNGSDILIGGLARIIDSVDNPATQIEATEMVKAMVEECGNLNPILRLPPESAADYIKKRRLSEVETKAIQKELDDKAIKLSKERSGQLKDLYTFLFINRQRFDLPAILTGDFSSSPELKTILAEFGIVDFKNYLAKIQKTFRELDINYYQRGQLSERAKAIYPDPEALKTPVDSMTKKDVGLLLESVRHYRAALVMRERFDYKNYYKFDEDPFGQIYKDHLQKKTAALARAYSQTPEEQQLLEQLYTNEIVDRYTRDSGILESQLMASVFIELQLGRKYYEFYNGFKKYSPFVSSLSDGFFRFRVAPCLGGSIIDDLAQESPADINRGVEPWKSLGESLDTLRAYRGRLRVVRDEYGYYHFEPAPLSLMGRIMVITSRKNAIPVRDQEILPVNYYEDVDDLPQDPAQLWEGFKHVAEATSFEAKPLADIASVQGVSAEEKKTYFISLIKEGKITYQQIFDAIFNESIFRDNSYIGDQKQLDSLSMAYEVGMTLLKSLPLYPSYQDINISQISQRLFKAKVQIAMRKRYGLDKDPNTPTSEELYEKLSSAEKLEFIFDFVKEGGTIKLSPDNKEGTSPLYISGLEKSGADVNILNILRDLGYPSQLVEKKVKELLESEKERYTLFERDKWKSLVAFTKQPYMYGQIRSWEAEPLWKIIAEDGRIIEYDPLNISQWNMIVEAIESLPISTYRDDSLSGIISMSCSGRFQDILKDHPGKDYIEKRIAQFAASSFSEVGIGPTESYQSTFQDSIINSVPNYIPGSEKTINDPLAGFYLKYTEAVSAWSLLIKGNVGIYIDNVFSPKYRDVLAGQKITGLAAELRILSERLKLLSQMPKSQLKEALILYTIKSAQEKEVEFSGKELRELRSQIKTSIDSSLSSFVSNQGKEGIFDMRLRNDLNLAVGPISSQVLQDRFPTKDAFLDYLVGFLPEKSQARDTYLLMAINAYPMRVGDAQGMRSLIFAGDFRTDDEGVLKQRAGRELIRSLKKQEDVTKQDIRELILWLIDDKRQVKAAEEFFSNISNDEAGRKLVRGLLEEMEILKPDNEDEEKKKGKFAKKIEKAGIDALTKSLIVLPVSIKKAIVEKLIFGTMNFRPSYQFDRNITLMRSGLPAIFRKIPWSQNTTFNSLLEGRSLENPAKREIFNELILGEKGLLESPLVSQSDDFKKRMSRNFDGEQMHKFIDDIMEMVFRSGNWDKKSKEVARVVSHSFIEAIDPLRRARVIFNLLSELPKVDVNNPDRDKVRSQFLQVALSSIGVLGAKLGQIDELIPPGWGSQMSSLKHGAKSMSKLLVADIFAQEGLSNEYTIIDSAGAASTACGYVVANPQGEKQFVKVLRPEVKLDWQGDFAAVRHMLACLKATGHLSVETEPIISQIEKLVRQELQTQREVENAIVYVSAETEKARQARGGIRAVEMPKARIGVDGQVIAPVPDSSIILEELLPKSAFVELSKLVSGSEKTEFDLVRLRESLDMNLIYLTIIEDFFFRAFHLGSWHADLHDGNILISRDNTHGVRREVKGDDLILIDFGQTGTAETEMNKLNAARFFMGLALKDRSLVAQAIHEAMDKPASIEDIEKELGINPFKIQERVTEYLAQHQTAEYLSNFLKASINVLPYLRKLPFKMQFELIAPYIGEGERKKGWVKIQEALATKNFTKLFI